MVSNKWCYKLAKDRRYEVFIVSTPVTKRQAVYLIKKKLKIKEISVVDVVPCSTLLK